MRRRGVIRAGAALVSLVAVVVGPGRVVAQERLPAAVPLTLGEAVARALAEHPSLAEARAVEARAASGIREARAARLPSLATEWSASRFQEPMVVAPLHGFDPSRPPVFDRSLVQGGLAVTYTLYDGGLRGARIGRAEALTEAASSGVAASRSVLLSEVVRAYLRVRAAREVEEAHGRRIAAVERERDRAARLHEQGRAPRVAVLRADAALSTARADGVAAEEDRGVAEGELARLMGLDAGSIAGRPLGDVRWTQRAAVPDRGVLLERAAAANPELVRLRRQVEAAERGSSEARSLWLPKVQLVGRYSAYGAEGYDPTAEWQGGVQVSYPLFTGGARLAVADRAEAEWSVARAAQALAELRIAEAVDRSAAAVESARARIAALESAVAQSEEVARIEKLALDTGAGVQTDYLAAEAELFRVRAALVGARHAEIGGRVELARLAGELDAGWLEDNLESGR